MKKIILTTVFLSFIFIQNTFGNRWVKLTEKGNIAGAPEVTLLSDTGSEMIIEVKLNGFYTKTIQSKNQIFNLIDFEDAGKLTVVGVPDIPYVSRILAIANSGNPVAEVIETGDKIKLKDYYLPPVRKSWIEGEEESEYLTDKNHYQVDSLFPKVQVKFDKPAIFRDFRIARLSVFPIRYNPVLKELEITTYMKVKITYNQMNSINEKSVTLSNKISPTFDRLYRAIIFNYDQALKNSGKTTKGGRDLMLCIMPDNFYNSFLRYADWKRVTGVDVHITKFSEIGANSSNPEIIKSYISQAYSTWTIPPTHVLLVGDNGIAPVKYVHYDYSFVNEDYFVEVDGDDFIPEMLFGRFTNQGDYRLRVMIDKFIKYEQLHAGDDPEWFTRAAVCSNNYYDSQVITKRFTARVLREDGGFTIVDTLMSKDGCPYTLQDVKDKINAGISFLNYRGEGWNDGWHASCYNFTPSDVASLHNEMKLPFVTSIGCGVAMFDASEGNCFGETWIQLGAFDYQRGAAAFLGPTSNTHTTYNNRIDKGIYVGMFREGMEMPAEALLRGKFYMYYIFGDSHWVEYHFRIYTTLGDPSIHIWKGTPVEPNVLLPEQLVVGYNQMNLHVENSYRQPIPDAQVILYNNNIFQTAYTNNNGDVYFETTVQDPGKIYVTVRGSKVALLRDSVNIVLEDEMVGLDGKPQLSDEAGNGDGLAEPNENFSLSFALKNWGAETAQNVTATLSIPDSIDFVEVLTSSPIQYGNIDPNESIEGNAFELRTTENAVIDSVIPITVTIQSANKNWDYYYYLKIAGCKLRYKNYIVDDEGSQEANFELDPSETAKIYVNVINKGNGIAANVHAILRSLDPNITVIDSEAVFGNIDPHSDMSNSDDEFVVSVSDDCPRNYQARMAILLETTNGNYSYSTVRKFFVDVSKPSFADPTGPDNYGYYAYDILDTNYTESPEFNWEEIENVGTEISITGSDFWTTINLPFNFTFYGESFNQITVCTDGWAALGSPNVPDDEWHNKPIPHADGINNLLSIFWDDYISDGLGNGKLYYYFNQHKKTFIIEWKDVDHYGDPNSRETFEIILFSPDIYPTQTGDGEVLFQYMNCEESGHGTIGIENGSEDDGIQFSYNGAREVTAAEVQGNYAVKFTTDTPKLILGTDDNLNVVTKFELMQNYPNPFNPTTTIKYSIPAGIQFAKSGGNHVSLRVYNILGEEVATLVNYRQTPGNYTVTFNASNLPSGIYFYRLTYGRFFAVKKMILLK